MLLNCIIPQGINLQQLQKVNLIIFHHSKNISNSSFESLENKLMDIVDWKLFKDTNKIIFYKVDSNEKEFDIKSLKSQFDEINMGLTIQKLLKRGAIMTIVIFNNIDQIFF